jgi:flavorubredoxin
MITNSQSGTDITEVASGIYRISTPYHDLPGGFSFNQYLVVDDDCLLFHTGFRKLFPLVREAIEKVIPLPRLRYISFSHFESDECGALNLFLAAAPNAQPACGAIGALVSIGDFADREPLSLADGQSLTLGARSLRWLDTPHVPHGWDCGLLFDPHTSTLLCGDLFTQGGDGREPLTEADILEPSEKFRQPLDYFAHTATTRPVLERLAELKPQTLACMHGSAWRGDGATLLRSLAEVLGRSQQRNA